MKKILTALLCAILWLLDFDHILVYILIPGGLVAVGVLIEAGWLYYVLALGIYGGIIWMLGRLIDRIADRAARSGVEKLEKWLHKHNQ